MKRVFTTIAWLVAAQALMLGIWYAVERGRAPETRPAVTTGQTAPMNRPTPDLELRRPDGTVFRLSEAHGRPLVLHFWATWCPPCREELPALLAYAAEGDMAVLAVSLDPDFGPVRRFLGSDLPPPVVLVDGGVVDDALGVRDLSVTFIADRRGRLRLRLDGPRDWTSAATRDAVMEGVRP